jgi:hypothetical protein
MIMHLIISWPRCMLEKSLSYNPVVLKRQLDTNINYTKLSNYLN